MVQYFLSFTSEEDNRMLTEKVTLEELKVVLNSFQKDKILGSDGWTIEFFLGFFDSIGQDILSLVEETRLTRQMPLSLNSTFISLIPKKDNLDTLDDFGPISLCNCIYKIISKVIAIRLKIVLSDKISLEQFGILEGRQIHEAIGVAQEALHSIKTRKLKSVVLKIDLSKAYDKVSWLYLRLLLTHLGFTVPFIKWIMCCITTVTFSVLINGSATDFFRSERGLRQGSPLSPLLFLLVVEGLSRALAAEKRSGSFPGIKISNTLHVTHLLFVDDILVFSARTRGEDDNLNNTLKLFSKATEMIINEGKSTLTTLCLSEMEKIRYKLHFPFEEKTIDEGLKYLGFTLKPNDYRKEDWSLILKKLEKKVMFMEPQMAFQSWHIGTSKISFGSHPSLLDVSILDPKRNFGGS
jgi:hypothetical protein